MKHEIHLTTNLTTYLTTESIAQPGAANSSSGTPALGSLPGPCAAISSSGNLVTINTKLIFMFMNHQQVMKHILHQFLYNPMVHECGWVTISTHKTPEGAETAKELHISEAYKDWLDEYPTEDLRKSNPFGKDEDWRIGITELLD